MQNKWDLGKEKTWCFLLGTHLYLRKERVNYFLGSSIENGEALLLVGF
jgi:hypothetical protein